MASSLYPSISLPSFGASGVSTTMLPPQKKPMAPLVTVKRPQMPVAPAQPIGSGPALPAVPQIRNAPSATPMPTAPLPMAPAAPTIAPQVPAANQNPPPNAQAPMLPAAPQNRASDDLAKAYQDSLKISPEELTTQADLDRLLESSRKAYTNAENQAIPLEFITGQQRALEQRANDLAEPLQTKLARLQAARMAASGASKFALDRADKQATDASAAADAKQKPVEVGGNIVKFNPETGKYETVYEGAKQAADGFTLGEGQQRYDANGNLIASGPGKAATPGDKIVNINGTDYVRNSDGTFSIPNVPSSGNSSELKTNALSAAQSLLEKFNAGRGTSAVGKSGFLGSFGYALIPGTERANFVTDFNSLKALLSLDNIKLLKGQGAVSDSERALLERASNKLNLAQSEDEFKKTLQELVTNLSNVGGGGGSGIDETNPEVQFLRGQGASDDDIKKVLGFKGDPGTSLKGPDVKKVTAAIGHFESGGNYAAVGPRTNSGDRAYGKYQIMGANVPAWSREVLGKEIGVQEFLSNPAIQDAIAEKKIGQYVSKYGSVEDAASAWFSGRPLAKAGNAKDVIGTSVPQYVKNVRSIYDRLA